MGKIFRPLIILMCLAVSACLPTPTSSDSELVRNGAKRTHLDQERSLSASPSQLVGVWETANVNQPFDVSNPALTLRFAVDGSLIADESTNREMRGTWTLQGEQVITRFSDLRYSNHLRQFDDSKNSMVLDYEMYANKPMSLRKVK
jgi:hypothetical protein